MAGGDTAPAATLRAAACAVLHAVEPADKVRLTHAAAARWFAGLIPDLGSEQPPERPGRPERPQLAFPRDMPKRGRGGSTANRTALLHALAHIELNAIDLAWDAVARDWGATLPPAFYDDWVRVADDEARHFTLLEQGLARLGAAYGDLPAHDGLWQSATATAHDLAARLAVVPLVLEARALDVTPATVARMRAMGETADADALQEIFDDEIGHVAAGSRWFHHLAAQRGIDAAGLWRELVATYFKGQLKPPFNVADRSRAGLPRHFYDS